MKKRSGYSGDSAPSGDPKGAQEDTPHPSDEALEDCMGEHVLRPESEQKHGE